MTLPPARVCRAPWSRRTARSPYSAPIGCCEIDLDETGLAGAERSCGEHREASDGIVGAEMEMHWQPIAQRRLGISRNAHTKIDPADRRVPLRRYDPVAAAGLGAIGKRRRPH